jgi:hypothetical protein
VAKTWANVRGAAAAGGRLGAECLVVLGHLADFSERRFGPRGPEIGGLVGGALTSGALWGCLGDASGESNRCLSIGSARAATHHAFRSVAMDQWRSNKCWKARDRRSLASWRDANARRRRPLFSASSLVEVAQVDRCGIDRSIVSMGVGRRAAGLRTRIGAVRRYAPPMPRPLRGLCGRAGEPCFLSPVQPSSRFSSSGLHFIQAATLFLSR